MYHTTLAKVGALESSSSLSGIGVQSTRSADAPLHDINTGRSSQSPLYSRVASAYHSPIGEAAEEVAEVHGEPRMLRDDTDRLCKIPRIPSIKCLELILS